MELGRVQIWSNNLKTSIWIHLLANHEPGFHEEARTRTKSTDPNCWSANPEHGIRPTHGIDLGRCRSGDLDSEGFCGICAPVEESERSSYSPTQCISDTSYSTVPLHPCPWVSEGVSEGVELSQAASCTAVHVNVLLLLRTIRI